MRYYTQMFAAVVSLPFCYAFQFIGVFANSCYIGFMLGWKQTWIKERRKR